METTNRKQRATIGRLTVRIIEQGGYEAPSGARVDLAEDLEKMKSATRVYTPDDLERLLAGQTTDAEHATRIEVVNETTLAAARRLADDASDDSTVLALNFASARNPGGGFLGGSQAQEESLARASGLYGSLLKADDYYAANRACRSTLYTDHLIHSPRTPVFRDDADELLESPVRVSFITAPAPNAGAVRSNRPEDAKHIEPTLARRIDHVLAVAREHGHLDLVLGAWGCGVFKNDPDAVARLFAQALRAHFAGAFRRVVFAVLDFSDTRRTFRAFEKQLTDPESRNEP